MSEDSLGGNCVYLGREQRLSPETPTRTQDWETGEASRT